MPKVHTGEHRQRRSSGTRRQADQRAAQTHRLAETCDTECRRRLRHEAARLNMGLARSVATRYLGRGETADDLMQVAYVGLMKAVRGFDPTYGSDFRSYAVPTIAGEVRRHFRDRSWVVKVPRCIQELQARISAARKRLTHKLGRQPSLKELADHLGTSVDDVREALSADGCFTPTSFDDRGGTGDGYTLHERLGADDADLERTEIRLVLLPLIHRLPERDRRIVLLRFVWGCTQTQIASDLGLTQMQVSRLLRRILDQLRAQLAAT